MSFISGVLLNMLEKELSSHSPEVEAYVLGLLGEISADVMAYLEKKIGITPQAPLPPE